MKAARVEIEIAEVRRRVRVVLLLDAADYAGISPVPTLALHALAYFCDALLPVWHLSIGEAYLLKRADGPMSPTLQRDVDELVGRGVLVASRVRHVPDGGSRWRLEADYSLNRAFADRVIAELAEHPEQAQIAGAVREVVLALSSIGLDNALSATSADATYGNDLVDVGGVVSLLPEDGRENASIRVARRFARLTKESSSLTPAEMAHLYIRELFRRVENAA
jgi:hypothetical protein